MDAWAKARNAMVKQQLAQRGIADRAVLDAMREIPREEFVAPALAESAYEDSPLPIDEGQTISQPYIVARMVEALQLGPDDRVLEVGAGSGYAAAVLGKVAREVYAIERHEALAKSAAERCRRLGYDNVHVRHGDGSLGWPEAAPFDAIVVAAGGPDVPEPLVGQLAPGGRLVMPVGADRHEQELVRLTLGDDGEVRRELLDFVRFVPLVGAAGWTELGAPAVPAKSTPRRPRRPGPLDPGTERREFPARTRSC